MTSKSIQKSQSRTGLVILAFVAFISLGLPDGLLGVGWPSIRNSFSLPLDALGLLLIATTAGYLTSSFSSGFLVSRMGVGWVLTASCALTGAGLIGFTLAPAWWVMICLGVAAGLGAGAIDAGLNTYIAANFGDGMMQWLHASYGIGVTLGPLIMTGALSFYNSWRIGYASVGITQICLAACFLLTLPMWKIGKNAPSHEDDHKMAQNKTPFINTLRQPQVLISISMFLLYTGAEASLGAWAYTLLTESRSINPNIAGLVAGSYWAMFTAGRLLAGMFARRASVHKMIRVGLYGAILGSVLVWWNPTENLSIFGIALIGFAIAPVFPGLVSGTNRRVGPRYAVNTIGMQIGSAGLGAAVIPGTVGVLANRISLEVIPLCLFILFASILALFTLSNRMLSR